MKIYYARPISLYGTKQDERDLKFLESMGFEINETVGDTLKKRKSLRERRDGPN